MGVNVELTPGMVQRQQFIANVSPKHNLTMIHTSGSIKNPSQLSKENAAGASINIRIPYDTDDHGKDYFEMGIGKLGQDG